MPIADLVARVLARREGRAPPGVGRATLEVFRAFARLGPPLSEHARPAAYRRGVLSLEVGESAWLTELTFLTPELIERLNRLLGGPLIREIRLRLGTLEKTRPPPPTPPPVLTHAQRELIARWTAPIADPDLREALARAAARSLERTDPTGRPLRRRPPYEGPPGPTPSKAEPPPAEPPPPDRWAPDRDRWAADRDRWRDRKAAKDR